MNTINPNDIYESFQENLRTGRWSLRPFPESFEIPQEFDSHGAVNLSDDHSTVFFSQAIPEKYREIVAFHEFQCPVARRNCNDHAGCLHAVHAELKIVPKNIYAEYVEWRMHFFQGLISWATSSNPSLVPYVQASLDFLISEVSDIRKHLDSGGIPSDKENTLVEDGVTVQSGESTISKPVLIMNEDIKARAKQLVRDFPLPEGEGSVPEPVGQLYDREIALEIIKGSVFGRMSGYEQFKWLNDNLRRFQGLDTEVALALIDYMHGGGAVFMNNLNIFQGLDYETIALALIESGDGDMLADNLSQFQGIDHKFIALKMMESPDHWYGDAFDENLSQFQGLDEEFALKMIENGYGMILAQHLDKFPGIDHKAIALKLIDGRKHCFGYDSLHSVLTDDWSTKLDELDEAVALTLLEIIYLRSLRSDLVKFQLDEEVTLKLNTLTNTLHQSQLDKEIALVLVDNGYGEFVRDNLEKFQGLDDAILAAIQKGGKTNSFFTDFLVILLVSFVNTE